ncbi:ExbD/TolR family protein [Haliangium ochraceum]|uniref:Biopolymer transport protein ExbD/TolR n=1 Tax=Haliangium ochraceum (strain DSM 14365 / JCM 11303 / SMP-2) TaxID=502025 RepID=D0LJZ5_HALO1|nr:biopolymer transporter ExbD [Haliangium ochraceum]ACY18502.1 Biopolymer transport protein ExbD/TolR [Haliangium ochraceum DSM 14365]
MAGGGGKRGRLRHVKKPKLDEVRNEINVTPLVDVCLVLLIIFMVVTPMLARGKDVPLPRTLHHSSDPDEAQPIVVVDKDGRVYYDKDDLGSLETLKQTDFGALKDRIDEVWRSDEAVPQRVLFKADKDLPYKDVYPVIVAIHDLGLGNVDLGSNELKDDE